MSGKYIIAIFIIFFLNECYAQKIEQEIVLVNIGSLDRSGVAKEIALICSLNPKVISIDVTFAGKKPKDIELIESLWNCRANLIVPSRSHNIGNGQFYFVTTTEPEFLPSNSTTGFVDAELENDERHTLKKFIVKQKDSFGKNKYHFSIKTAMSFDSLKTINFIKEHANIIDIDFKNKKRLFKSFSSQEILNGSVTKKDIEGKIVMIGFLGPGNEDKFVTPYNNDPNEPDMYGLEYLANVVAQVLEDK